MAKIVESSRARTVADGGRASTKDISPTISPALRRAISRSAPRRPLSQTPSRPSRRMKMASRGTPCWMRVAPAGTSCLAPLSSIHSTSSSFNWPKRKRTFLIDSFPSGDLALGKTGEGAAAAEEVPVGPLLHDPPSLDDVDPVGVLDGAQAMGDDDASRLETLEALADDLL